MDGRGRGTHGAITKISATLLLSSIHGRGQGVSSEEEGVLRTGMWVEDRSHLHPPNCDISYDTVQIAILQLLF